MGNSNLKVGGSIAADDIQGGFGKVWRTSRKKTLTSYALKEMSKARIITKRSVKSVINERQILAQLNNPFIVNMHYAFQDRENLYLVMDYLSGGDLRYHICRYRKFNEETTRFFVACLIAALEYIHEKNIIHRDIKPENLVIEQDGYLRLTDFGIARVWREENAQDTSGTPGYMAPEVMCRQNHTCTVDYFAVGVIAYECMFGRRPYVGKSRKEIRDHILSKQIQIKRQDIPRGWSVEAADFINKMIQRKPQNRLGAVEGAADVKDHPWLRDFPFDDLYQKKVPAPFIPPNDDNFDQKNINEEWRDLEDDDFKQNQSSLHQGSVQEMFSGYYYDYALMQLSQYEEVRESGITEQIVRNLAEQELASQMADPQKNCNFETASSQTSFASTSFASGQNNLANGAISTQPPTLMQQHHQQQNQYGQNQQAVSYSGNLIGQQQNRNPSSKQPQNLNNLREDASLLQNYKKVKQTAQITSGRPSQAKTHKLSSSAKGNASKSGSGNISHANLSPAEGITILQSNPGLQNQQSFKQQNTNSINNVNVGNRYPQPTPNQILQQSLSSYDVAPSANTQDQTPLETANNLQQMQIQAQQQQTSTNGFLQHQTNPSSHNVMQQAQNGQKPHNLQLYNVQHSHHNSQHQNQLLTQHALTTQQQLLSHSNIQQSPNNQDTSTFFGQAHQQQQQQAQQQVQVQQLQQREYIVQGGRQQIQQIQRENGVQSSRTIDNKLALAQQQTSMPSNQNTGIGSGFAQQQQNALVQNNVILQKGHTMPSKKISAPNIVNHAVNGINVQEQPPIASLSISQCSSSQHGSALTTNKNSTFTAPGSQFPIHQQQQMSQKNQGQNQQQQQHMRQSLQFQQQMMLQQQQHQQQKQQLAYQLQQHQQQMNSTHLPTPQGHNNPTSNMTNTQHNAMFIQENKKKIVTTASAVQQKTGSKHGQRHGSGYNPSGTAAALGAHLVKSECPTPKKELQPVNQVKQFYTRKNSSTVQVIEPAQLPIGVNNKTQSSKGGVSTAGGSSKHTSRQTSGNRSSFTNSKMVSPSQQQTANQVSGGTVQHSSGKASMMTNQALNLVPKNNAGQGGFTGYAAINGNNSRTGQIDQHQLHMTQPMTTLSSGSKQGAAQLGGTQVLQGNNGPVAQNSFQYSLQQAQMRLSACGNKATGYQTGYGAAASNGAMHGKISLRQSNKYTSQQQVAIAGTQKSQSNILNNTLNMKHISTSATAAAGAVQVSGNGLMVSVEGQQQLTDGGSVGSDGANSKQRLHVSKAPKSPLASQSYTYDLTHGKMARGGAVPQDSHLPQMGSHYHTGPSNATYPGNKLGGMARQ